MAEEINNGNAYLTALKQASGADSAAAVATAPAREHSEPQAGTIEAAAAPSSQFSGSEILLI